MRAFAIDVFKCSLMDNHLHLLLRNRPDLVEQWTDEEVARRWWEVCPERVEPDGTASEPLPVELAQWLDDPEQMLELRKQRLARALALGLDTEALTQDGGLPIDVLCEDPSDADAWLSRMTLDVEQRLTQHLSQWFEEADSIWSTTSLVGSE